MHFLCFSYNGGTIATALLQKYGNKLFSYFPVDQSFITDVIAVVHSNISGKTVLNN